MHDDLEQVLERAQPKLTMIKEKLERHNIEAASIWNLDKLLDALGLTEIEKFNYNLAKEHHFKTKHGKNIFDI